ncbi:MAG: HEPN domain-containing protein [Bdellovibrionales bacterium]
MKEIKYKRDYAKTLIEIADLDLESAELLMNSKPKRMENAFFLAQQATDKALKAVLCHIDRPVPLTHDLNIVIHCIGYAYKVPLADSVVELTEFATIRRYEGSVIEYTTEELVATIDGIKTLIDWATEIIKS